MRIGMVGTGYAGLVSGTCFAAFGVNVVCCDKDASKIARLNKGEMPIYEQGLDELVAAQVEAGRLSFTSDIKAAVAGMDAVFIAVGTPARADNGHADMSYVYAAAKEIGAALQGYTVIVTKSTVPVGTAREIQRIIREVNPKAEFDVCSNAEFMREGTAIVDFMEPDSVVIGADTERAFDVMRALYRPLIEKNVPMVFTTPETSEIIKYAGNAFLAMKITFINEIANLCEKAGANVSEVSKGIGLDARIGAKFLNAGPGYGGSCFPKDTMALAQIGRKYGAPQNIVETVIEVNTKRLEDMGRRVIAACDGDVKGKRICVLGLAFKPDTDDVREAPSLSVIPVLQEAGAKVAAFDPVAMEEAAKRLQNVEWCKDSYSAAKDADAIVVLTEWNEFRMLDLKRIAGSMKSKRLIDLRNIYKPADAAALGFRYVSIGRKEIA